MAASVAGSKRFEGFLAGLALEFRSIAPRPAPASAAEKAARIIEEAADRGTARGLADRAAMSLLLGDADTAVTLLEQAAKLKPEAEILSDLAAAYLARAESGGEALQDRKRALSAANQALSRAPHLREAVCNRALALEKLYLRYPAWLGWKACWRKEETGPFGWEQIGPHLTGTRPLALNKSHRLKDELRKAASLGVVEVLRKLVAANPKLGRKAAEEEIGKWASMFLKGERSQATAALTLAEKISDALRRSTGDGFLWDVVADLRTRPESDLETLAEAIRSCQIGMDLTEHSRYTTAAQTLRKAHARLSRSGSVYQVRALYLLGLSEGYGKQQDQALGLLYSAADLSRRSGYVGVLAESLWMIGLFEMDLGETEKALQAYQGSLAAFESLKDQEGMAGARNIIAELLEELGGSEEAWRNLQSALAQTPQLTSSQTIFQIYTTAAMTAFRRDLPEVAVEFQNEAVRYAADVSLVAQCEALFWRSRFLQRLGRLDLALKDIRLARQKATGIADASGGRIVESDLLLTEAEAVLAASPEKAIQILNADLGSGLMRQVHRFEGFLLRARAWRAVGAWRQEEEDLASAIEMVERRRESINASDLKISFLDKVQQAYDEMILLQAEDLDDPESALDFLERKRARVLLEEMLAISQDLPERARRLPGEPSPLKTWSRQLPSHVVLVSYARIKDRVLVWVTDRRGLRDFQIVRGIAELESAAQRIRQAAQNGGGDQDIKSDAEALFGSLLRPIRDALPPDSHLVFNRGDFLADLPFSLLRDPETGRYLIEDHPLSVVPSANSYVMSLRRSRVLRRGADAKALFVGNPAFDRSLFGELVDLPRASREARALADLYGPSAKALIGKEATEEAFLRELDNHDVVQFSGHAVVDRNRPLRSALVLASSSNGGGILRAHEIHGRNFLRAQLVILSACGSSDGLLSQSEGGQSLSRAFVAAGVPAVIGTLWDINDDENQELLLELHRSLRRGHDVATSLREAQVQLLRNKTATRHSPLAWAAFELTGGR